METLLTHGIGCCTNTHNTSVQYCRAVTKTKKLPQLHQSHLHPGRSVCHTHKPSALCETVTTICHQCADCRLACKQSPAQHACKPAGHHTRVSPARFPCMCSMNMALPLPGCPSDVYSCMCSMNRSPLRSLSAPRPPCTIMLPAAVVVVANQPSGPGPLPDTCSLCHWLLLLLLWGASGASAVWGLMGDRQYSTSVKLPAPAWTTGGQCKGGGIAVRSGVRGDINSEGDK